MWPAIGNVEQVNLIRNHLPKQILKLSISLKMIIDLRLGYFQQNHQHHLALASIRDDDGSIEIGMKTAETQTELIDDCSPAMDEYQIINESISSDNNNQASLNINSIEMIKDLKCIDDDSASGRRILFTQPLSSNTPETKL